jgi:hypothetical protein
LAEQLSPTSFLVISGKVTASAVGKGWSGTLRGTMGVAPKLVTGYAYFNPMCNGSKRFDLVSREP